MDHHRPGPGVAVQLMVAWCSIVAFRRADRKRLGEVVVMFELNTFENVLNKDEQMFIYIFYSSIPFDIEITIIRTTTVN